MSMLRLIRMDQPDRAPRPMSSGSVMIGRGMGCDVRIDDPTVSRRHARLDVSGDGSVWLTDMGSKNGTRVHDRVITRETVAVHAGDRLFIGDFCLGLVSDEVPIPCVPDSGMTICDDDAAYSSISSLPYEKALAAWRRDDLSMGKAYRALFDLIGLLVSNQSLDKMADVVLCRLQQVVGADRYAIFLGRGEKESLKLLALRSAQPAADTQFALSRTILKQALTERKALSLTDVPADQRFAEKDSVMLQGVHSVMVVPLIEQDHVVGVLYVDSKSPVHQYDENMLSVAVAFGHLLAAKIVQLQLFRERREKESLESELSVASGIQRDLMPASLPSLPGYSFYAFLEQTRMVGGDLYDVALRDDGSALLLQADVAGKGVGAALLAANVLSAFRMVWDTEDFDMEKAVERVSRHIVESTSDMQFATLFIGLLNPQTHCLEYVNAGHNPPLWIRRDGSLERLVHGYLPIGVDRDAVWKRETIELAPGDRLLVYTDGAPDAANASYEQYGMKRLEEYASANATSPPAEFIAGLLDDMENFTGDAPQTDDLTLLLVARE